MIDTETLKRNVNLVDLVGRFTPLKRIAVGEHEGPCPRCGGVDRIHCTATWFFCRQCHPERGDSIDFARWLKGLSFSEAVSWLGQPMPEPMKSQPVNGKSQRSPMRQWDFPAWQNDAKSIVGAAQERLNGSGGEPGREYLVGRGFQPETWLAWGLGYTDNWKERGRPAIILPWQAGGVIKHVQARFIDDGEQRYDSKTGGQRTLYGVGLLRRTKVLVCTEGELNAIATWQATHASGVDCVSWGSQDSLTGAATYLARIAQGYQLVVVWADEPDYALRAVTATGVAAVPVKSKHLGVKQDANDLLRLGMLGGLIAGLRLHFQGWQETVSGLYQAARSPGGIDAWECDLLTRFQPCALAANSAGRWMIDGG